MIVAKGYVCCYRQVVAGAKGVGTVAALAMDRASG